MFRRRKRLKILDRARSMIWPRSGWRRTSTYVLHRIRRLPGSPYSIAAGFACGAAISFTPFIGAHFAGAAIIAWILGGNLLASAIGTLVGNPWTFPLIWLSSYKIGKWVLGTNGVVALPEQLTMTYIFANPSAVLLPMTVAGVPMALVAWIISFWLVRRAVARYQTMRRHRRERSNSGLPRGSVV